VYDVSVVKWGFHRFEEFAAEDIYLVFVGILEGEGRGQVLVCDVVVVCAPVVGASLALAT
jgi:hypothetical protein